MTVTLEGRFNCGPKCDPADYILLLNLVSVSSGTFPVIANASCGCHCGNCAFPVSVTTGYQDGSGWTAYNRGAANYLQVYLPPFFQQLVVCLSGVTLDVEWEDAVDTPLALAFEPHLGPLGGATLVNISGFNFDSQGQYQCDFGGVHQVPGTVLSPVVVQCLSPPWSEHQSSGSDNFTPVDFTLKLGSARISNFTDQFLYYNQPQIERLLPASGNISSSTLVRILGSGFINTLLLSCQFGDYRPRTATFISSTELQCTSPPWIRGGPSVVALEITENGQDFTDDQVTYTYIGVPILGSLQLWELLLVLAGSAIVLAVLITIVAVCFYRRARSKDKKRRFLDASDSEDETEPLISAIQSRSLRQVLAKVERVDISDLKIDRRIGRGSFGEVYHAYWAGTEIGLKKLPKHMLSNQKLLEDFAQEITILAGLRHPNVLQFLGVAVDKVSLYMLTEFMDRGSLYDVLHDPKEPLPMNRVLNMLIDTSRGMSYLHKRLIHRDLKSHNLLVDSHWVVKICDFGLSRLKQESNTLTACGTPCWTAPEVLRNEHYTEKADVYSFGIVIWECLTREDPFAGMPPFHVVFVVGSQGARPEVPACKPEWPQALLDLMEHAWQEDPDIRPSFPELIVSLQEIFRNHEMEAISMASSPLEGGLSTSIN